MEGASLARIEGSDRRGSDRSVQAVHESVDAARRGRKTTRPIQHLLSETPSDLTRNMAYNNVYHAISKISSNANSKNIFRVL